MRFPGCESSIRPVTFADSHYSSELSATATLDDLSYEYMCEYMVRVGAREEDTRALPKVGMVRALGLMGGASGERARNFAVLMFTELATSAILYKDHSRPDYVGIYACVDRMTFVNHNRPLPPVTIEDLNEREGFDGRGCVNSELKDMFFALGLIESFGSEETFAETVPRNIVQGH